MSLIELEQKIAAEEEHEEEIVVAATKVFQDSQVNLDCLGFLDVRACLIQALGH